MAAFVEYSTRLSALLLHLLWCYALFAWELLDADNGFGYTQQSGKKHHKFRSNYASQVQYQPESSADMHGTPCPQFSMRTEKCWSRCQAETSFLVQDTPNCFILCLLVTEDCIAVSLEIFLKCQVMPYDDEYQQMAILDGLQSSAVAVDYTILYQY